MFLFGFFTGVLALNALLVAVNCDGQIPNLNFNQGNDKKLPPCQACKLLVNSFKKGMEKTSRGKFEGGDAAWEEEKLRSYSRSEVRLVEIQERLCSDAKEYKDQCHAVSEITEGHVEEWWFKQGSETDDLLEYLCIHKMEYCCPDKHYGKDCLPCLGAPDNVCSGNGKCKGDGTRKGNGQCACDDGYQGVLCSDCAAGYYESYRDESKVLCSKCNKACRDGCSGGGVKACHVCHDGWRMDAESGCLDIDECLDKNKCRKDQFCVNDDGTYKCLACDKSCTSCTGDGPDMCESCASGYRLKDNLCTADKGLDSSYVTMTRYVTYFGLCVAICIIFQKSVWLAGIFGLMVALYISVAEYTLANDLAGPSPMIDANSIDWTSLLGKMT